MGTIKKTAVKLARKLRTFGLSWADSHKYGKVIAKSYYDSIGMCELDLVEALYVEMDTDVFDKYFSQENYLYHPDEDGDSWTEVDYVCRRTGTSFHSCSY